MAAALNDKFESFLLKKLRFLNRSFVVVFHQTYIVKLKAAVNFDSIIIARAIMLKALRTVTRQFQHHIFFNKTFSEVFQDNINRGSQSILETFRF